MLVALMASLMFQRWHNSMAGYRLILADQSSCLQQVTCTAMPALWTAEVTVATVQQSQAWKSTVPAGHRSP